MADAELCAPCWARAPLAPGRGACEAAPHIACTAESAANAACRRGGSDLALATGCHRFAILSRGGALWPPAREDGVRRPQHKTDIEAARALLDAPLDMLAEHYAELLEWLQDMNWPVARPVAAALAQADDRIVPQVRAILRGTDSIWKAWVISELLENTRCSVVQALEVELRDLANRPTPEERTEEVDLAAREVLRRIGGEPYDRS